jgi:hypothetical protein
MPGSGEVEVGVIMKWAPGNAEIAGRYERIVP